MSISSEIIALGEQLPVGATLVAVSKTHPVEALRQAYDAGQRIFGENRPQEMAAKRDAMPRDTRWHMIGHLQSNKVRLIAPFVELIHSVDSRRLLDAINAEALRVGRVQEVLFEVHIAAEASKTGFSPDELLNFSHEFDGGFGGSAFTAAYPNVRVRGLMGIATFTDDVGQVRREFMSLSTLFERLSGRVGVIAEAGYVPVSDDSDGFSAGHFDVLSMGMSADWRVALECGATMVRVGSTIFGARDYGAAAAPIMQ